jgi:hypothetical protein
MSDTKFMFESQFDALVDLTNQLTELENRLMKRAAATNDPATVQNAVQQAAALRKEFSERQAKFIVKHMMSTLEVEEES